MIKSIVLIGAGNVATHLGTILQNNGYELVQLWSRTSDSMNILSEKLDIPGTISINEIVDDADLYLFCINDESLIDISKMLGEKKGIYVHTSGSVPMDVFKNITSSYGVFYPLQTFSKKLPIHDTRFPICIEGCRIEIEEELAGIANSIFGNESVHYLNSIQRKVLHISAVISCNFSNYLYGVSKAILDHEKVPFELLLPLIEETNKKIQKINPIDAQTGPAVRKDVRVIEEHLEYLKNFPQYRELYDLITKKIMDFN